MNDRVESADAACAAEEAAYAEGVDAGRESAACFLAAWMSARGFDCGEAGTVKDLLDRLEIQISCPVNFP